MGIHRPLEKMVRKFERILQESRAWQSKKQLLFITLITALLRLGEPVPCYDKPKCLQLKTSTQCKNPWTTEHRMVFYIKENCSTYKQTSLIVM